MLGKRLRKKTCIPTRRKSCTQGEAVSAEPQFPLVQLYAHRSRSDAMSWNDALIGRKGTTRSSMKVGA
jgi:hypothetical protein